MSKQIKRKNYKNLVTHISHYTEHISNRYPYHFSIPFQNEAELKLRRPLPEIKEVYVMAALDMT